MYNGNVQQNSLCAASCFTTDIPISPQFSPTIFYCLANSALYSAQYAVVYNNIFSIGAIMVLKNAKVLLPIIEIHVTLVGLQATHKPALLLYFLSLLCLFLAMVYFAGYFLVRFFCLLSLLFFPKLFPD